MHWQKSKIVPGTDGKYKLSYYGVLRKLVKGKWVKAKLVLNKRSRKQTTLILNNKQTTISISLLMGITFLNHKPCKQKVIDHKNNDCTNDALYNLQAISHRQNTTKDRKRLVSTQSGIRLKRGKYRPYITINRKQISLGNHENEQLATYVRNMALSMVNRYKGNREEFIKEIILAIYNGN